MFWLSEIFLVITLICIGKCFWSSNKSCLERILSHLLCCFHPSSSLPSHYNVWIWISIIKGVLSLFIMRILQHIHRINIRWQVISNSCFLVCMQVKEVCFVWDKRRVFWLLKCGRYKRVLNFFGFLTWLRTSSARFIQLIFLN